VKTYRARFRFEDGTETLSEGLMLQDVVALAGGLDNLLHLVAFTAERESPLMILDQITLAGVTRLNVELCTAFYSNGGTALLMRLPADEDGPGEDWPVSVNLVDVPPADGCIWVKTWSGNEGILAALTAAGVLEPTGRTQPTGFVHAHEARLLKEVPPCV